MVVVRLALGGKSADVEDQIVSSGEAREGAAIANAYVALVVVSLFQSLKSETLQPKKHKETRPRCDPTAKQEDSVVVVGEREAKWKEDDSTTSNREARVQIYWVVAVAEQGR